jgi:hypothetical protein
MTLSALVSWQLLILKIEVLSSLIRFNNLSNFAS